MRPPPAAIAAEALRLFRRDRTILLPVAGAFFFLPAFALALLVAPPPAMSGEMTTTVWANAFGEWARSQGHWYLLAWAVELWGTAGILRLYLLPSPPTVATALRGAAGLWPRLALLTLLSELMWGAGLYLFVLPGVYLHGRLLAAGAALTAERPPSAIGAIGRSFRLTRGHGLALAVLAAALLGGDLIARTFLPMLDAWLRAQGGGNPVAVAIVDGGAAAVSAAVSLGGALVGIVAYRLFAR